MESSVYQVDALALLILAMKLGGGGALSAPPPPNFIAGLSNADAFGDNEAAVWVATSENVPGLATEADTIEGNPC